MADTLIADAEAYLSQRLERYLRSGDVAIANVQRRAQRLVMNAVRAVFDEYFPDRTFNYARARQLGVQAYLHQHLDDAFRGLNASLSETVIENLSKVMVKGIEDGVRALGILKIPVIQVPAALNITDAQIRTWKPWQGATPMDRMLHITEQLKTSIETDIRRSLLNQESYEQLRTRIAKQFGVGRGVKPSFSAYGSVKEWRNSARRAWNEMMEDVYEVNDGTVALVWASALKSSSTKDCVERHGKTIVKLGGEKPPRHYNCLCYILYVPMDQLTDTLATMRGERAAWLKANPGARSVIKKKR